MENLHFKEGNLGKSSINDPFSTATATLNYQRFYQRFFWLFFSCLTACHGKVRKLCTLLWCFYLIIYDWFTVFFTKFGWSRLSYRWRLTTLMISRLRKCSRLSRDWIRRAVTQEHYTSHGSGVPGGTRDISISLWNLKWSLSRYYPDHLIYEKAAFPCSPSENSNFHFRKLWLDHQTFWTFRCILSVFSV